EPVDPSDPALAMLGIPLDRAQDALLPRYQRLPARLAVQLLVADAERHHVGDAGAEAGLVDDDVAVFGPEPALDTRAQDQVGPVGHRDVRALAVDVDVPGDSLRGDGEVAADAVGAEAEVAQRLARAAAYISARQRLRDDRAGHVARVLPRAVVVEHPRDDAR